MLNKMKSVVVAALGGVALGAALVGAVPALAAGGGLGRTDLQADLAQAASAQNRTCAVYVDTDGDGVCDNREATPGTGRYNGSGTGYVDADGDGVCDNYGTGAGGGHHGHHARGHHGGGRC